MKDLAWKGLAIRKKGEDEALLWWRRSKYRNQA
jgi:hypothetical protein